MAELKVLLVIPPYEFNDIYPDYQVSLPFLDNIKLVPGATQPLGLAYIISSLKKSGFTVEFIDGVFETEESMVEKIGKFDPDVLGIQTTSPIWEKALSLAEKIKQLKEDIIIGVGGSHVNTVGGSCIEDSNDLDFAVQGDGDLILKELCEEIEKGKNCFETSGVVWKDVNNEIIENKPLPRTIENLDEVPFPDHEIIDIEDYCPSIGFYRDLPSANLVTSRGCLNACEFCHARKFHHRQRSVENVIQEMKELKNLGVKDIIIYDQDFGAKPDFAFRLCEKIIENKLDFYIGANMRIDSFDEELLKKMKKAGFWRVFYGLESGVQKNLDRVFKNIKIEKSREVVENTDEIGLQVFGSFMFGIPEETYQEGIKTIEFAKSLPLSFAKFTAFSPWPGSEIWNNPEKYGSLDRSYKSMSMNKVNFVPNTMEKGDIDKLLKKGFREFYLRPNYIAKRVKNIRTWEDFKQNFRGLASFIRA